MRLEALIVSYTCPREWHPPTQRSGAFTGTVLLARLPVITLLDFSLCQRQPAERVRRELNETPLFHQQTYGAAKGGNDPNELCALGRGGNGHRILINIEAMCGK